MLCLYRRVCCQGWSHTPQIHFAVWCVEIVYGIYNTVAAVYFCLYPVSTAALLLISSIDASSKLIQGCNNLLHHPHPILSTSLRTSPPLSSSSLPPPHSLLLTPSSFVPLRPPDPSPVQPNYNGSRSSNPLSLLRQHRNCLYPPQNSSSSSGLDYHCSRAAVAQPSALLHHYLPKQASLPSLLALSPNIHSYCIIRPLG